MKKWCCLMSLVIVACSPTEVDQNSDMTLIPKADFVPLLVDLKILEEHFRVLYQRPEVFVKALDSSSQHIFKDYHVTKAQFQYSLNEYSMNPDTIFSIFEAALDTINLRISVRAIPAVQELKVD